MKKTISNRINMYVVVLDTCKKHEEELAGIPKMVSAVSDLENALIELNALAMQHSIKTLGVSSQKAQKLEQLFVALDEVHSAFKVLATELNDPGMKVRNSFPQTTLRRMSGVALKTHIGRVSEDLIQSGSLLEPYGLDNNRLGEILELIDDCKAIISTPRIAIVQRKNLTGAMLNKSQEIDRIVKERIDNIVRLLKRSLPDFFNEYFAARKVINTGVRHNQQTNRMNSGRLGQLPSEPDDGN